MSVYGLVRHWAELAEHSYLDTRQSPSFAVWQCCPLYPVPRHAQVILFGALCVHGESWRQGEGEQVMDSAWQRVPVKRVPVQSQVPDVSRQIPLF